MKIIITCKTGKSEDSTEKEIDLATDKLEKLAYFVDKNFKDFKWTGLKSMCDGTQVIFEN